MFSYSLLACRAYDCSLLQVSSLSTSLLSHLLCSMCPAVRPPATWPLYFSETPGPSTRTAWTKLIFQTENSYYHLLLVNVFESPIRTPSFLKRSSLSQIILVQSYSNTFLLCGALGLDILRLYVDYLYSHPESSLSVFPP